MKTILFQEMGSSLGTRPLGKTVRNKLIEQFSDHDKIIFDFENVNLITNSFADECFAKLLDVFTIDQIQEKTSFANMNEKIQFSIRSAFLRRLGSK